MTDDPIDSVDKIFIAVLRLTQQLDTQQDLVCYSSSLNGLAHQLASEVDGTHPLHLVWVGMTIQGILEEIMELIDVLIDSGLEDLVLMSDQTIEEIMAAAFGSKEETSTTEEGETYDS